MSYSIAQLHGHLSGIETRFPRAQVVSLEPRQSLNGKWRMIGRVHVHGGKHYEADIDRLRAGFDAEVLEFNRRYNLRSNDLSVPDIGAALCERVLAIADLAGVGSWCLHPDGRDEPMQDLLQRQKMPLLEEGIRALATLLPEVHSIHGYRASITMQGGAQRDRIWISFRGHDEEFVSMEATSLRQSLSSALSVADNKHSNTNRRRLQDLGLHLGVEELALPKILLWTQLLVADAGCYFVPLRMPG